MRLRALALLAVAASALLFAHLAAGLSAVAVDRGGAAAVESDGAAVWRLSGFNGPTLTLGNTYSLVGQGQNKADVSAQVRLTADPLVSVARRLVRVGRGEFECVDSLWRLELCWAPNTASQGTTTCGGGGQRLQFTGSGPGDPAAQTTPAITVPAGGTGYLLARIGTTLSWYDATVTFGWSLSYSGGSQGSVAHSSGVPRYQQYEVGSGC